jgi:ribosomal protein S18 acetylase RimI-like enzyme
VVGRLRPAGSRATYIRQALPADRLAVTETVAAAFARDPAWTYLLGEHYPRLAPEFAAALFDQRVGAGSVWVTADLDAVAMWEAPGTPARTGELDRETWASFHASADAPTRERLAAYDEAIHRARPSEPFWYLGVLATHPLRRRQGLAGALLTPVFELAAEQRLVCCLETSTNANRRFYEGRGYGVEREIALPGGPRTWWMRRPAG